MRYLDIIRQMEEQEAGRRPHRKSSRGKSYPAGYEINERYEKRVQPPHVKTPLARRPLKEGQFVRWRSGERVRGPARVELIDEKDGHRWVLVSRRGVPRWVSEFIIESGRS